jgi:large subunit ribosomal protein L18
MVKKIDRNAIRKAKKVKIRKKVNGTPERPRLAIFRSSSAIYAQLIDDVNGKTLVASSSKSLGLNGRNIEVSKKVGADIAVKAVSANIKSVVFDRAGYVYHGKVKAFADAARENGLEF